MTKTKYIIICAGDGTRWNDYLGVKKHFAVLNGEPILYRTIRLLKNNCIESDQIYVVSKDYMISEVINVNIQPDESNYDADKFLSSKNIWNKNGRTVIIYGDVYFTEQAIESIISYKGTDWKLFCRPKGSEITGTAWGECFAVSMYPEQHEHASGKLYELIDLYNSGKILRIGGWEWVGMMDNVPLSEIITTNKTESDLYFVIDDFTDDLDFPDDYENMSKALSQL